MEETGSDKNYSLLRKQLIVALRNTQWLVKKYRDLILEITTFYKAINNQHNDTA